MAMSQMAWARALDSGSRDFYNRGARQRANVGYGDNQDGPRPAAPRDSMIARNDWPCRFDNCGDRTVKPGVTRIVKRDGRWGHENCPQRPVQPSNPPTAVNSQAQPENGSQARQRAARAIPSGKYTVRPADESAHVVLSFEAPDFGSFPDGTMVVSVHGSFAPLGRNGLREHRSWLGIGLAFPDGRFNLYRPIREMISGPSTLPAEDAPARDKAIRASKAVRLILEAGTDQLMAYGKAWAMAEQKCFRCSSGLDDPKSQAEGIGPVCKRKFLAQTAG